MTHVVLIDNQDSFVYNLVDTFAVGGYRTTVLRNTVSVAEVLAAKPDLICLSPGPGHPTTAGNMMELVAAVLGKIPILGICLGFQALLEHFGGSVRPVGPVHGVTDNMTLTPAGMAAELFQGLTVDAAPDATTAGRLVPVARYHSLGCTLDETPSQLVPLGYTATAVGEVVMAASTTDQMALGLQYHPESVLSPAGPVMLDRAIAMLTAASSRGGA